MSLQHRHGGLISRHVARLVPTLHVCTEIVSVVIALFRRHVPPLIAGHVCLAVEVLRRELLMVVGIELISVGLTRDNVHFSFNYSFGVLGVVLARISLSKVVLVALRERVVIRLLLGYVRRKSPLAGSIKGCFGVGALRYLCVEIGVRLCLCLVHGHLFLRNV